MKTWYQSAFEDGRTVMIRVAADNAILTCSGAARSVLGHDPAAMVGRPLSDFAVDPLPGLHDGAPGTRAELGDHRFAHHRRTGHSADVRALVVRRIRLTRGQVD